MNLNLILGILFLAIILLSIHFSFFDKVIDSWSRTEDRVSKFLVVGIIGGAVLITIVWSLIRIF